MIDGYKTYLAAIIAFVIALLGVILEYLQGSEIHLELLTAAFIALAVLFLRQGIKKAE